MQLREKLSSPAEQTTNRQKFWIAAAAAYFEVQHIHFNPHGKSNHQLAWNSTKTSSAEPFPSTNTQLALKHRRIEWHTVHLLLLCSLHLQIFVFGVTLTSGIYVPVPQILLSWNCALILFYFPKEKLIIQRVKVRRAIFVSAMPSTSNDLKTHSTSGIEHSSSSAAHSNSIQQTE